MQLRKFLPYDVLGAGLWSALFCLLGYLFWRRSGRPGWPAARQA
jgi:undecaprenyl-diphosphatase